MKTNKSKMSILSGSRYFQKPQFHTGVLPVLIVCIISLCGCDKPFEPFQENDLYAFSLYGYLDASVDTQWVRVAPARQELNMPKEVPDIEVTLEHLQNGNSVVMNDSLFNSGGFNYLNFWTTMEIEHEQEYRLRTEHPDGEVSEVTITIPRELPTPKLLIEKTFGTPDPPTYRVYIDDSVEHIVDVQTRWYVRFYAPGFEEKKLYTFSYKNVGVHNQIHGGVFSYQLEPEVKEEEIRSNLSSGVEMEILHRQIFVASAGPDWNENIESLDDISYALPGSYSNIENGLGYMVGVSSKIIPFESCYDQGILVACEQEKPYW
jgi:hypothetical protein